MDNRNGSDRWSDHQTTHDRFYFPNPGMVHHYTDVEAASSILTSRKMRATHVKDLDQTEYTAGREAVKFVIDELVKDSFWSNHTDVLEEVYKRLPKDPPDIVVSCYCQTQDSSHMWENMASGKKECALMFSGDELFYQTEMLGRLVVYGKRQKLAQIRALFSQFKKAAKSAKVEWNQFADSLAKELLLQSAIYKNDLDKKQTYTKEREYRLYLVFFSSMAYAARKVYWPKIAKEGIEFDFDGDILPLHDIRFSPSCPPVKKAQLIDLAVSLGHKVSS